MSTIVAAAQHHPQIEEDRDDIESYIASFDGEELRDLAIADAALDIAILLYRAREHRGLSQSSAAKLAGLQQQAISRFEQASANPRLETLHEYLSALGYALEVRAIDRESGESVAIARLA